MELKNQPKKSGDLSVFSNREMWGPHLNAGSSAYFPSFCLWLFKMPCLLFVTEWLPALQLSTCTCSLPCSLHFDLAYPSLLASCCLSLPITKVYDLSVIHLRLLLYYICKDCWNLVHSFSSFIWKPQTPLFLQPLHSSWCHFQVSPCSGVTLQQRRCIPSATTEQMLKPLPAEHC